MPRAFSPAMARAILAESTDEVLLECLTIEAGETFRLVNNTEPMARAVGTFKPFPFEPVLPDDVVGARPTVLRVDNIDQQVEELVEGYQGVPTATVELVLASSPDIVEYGPCRFSVKGSEVDETTIELSLGFEDEFLSQTAPAQTWSPPNSPGMFR